MRRSLLDLVLIWLAAVRGLCRRAGRRLRNWIVSTRHPLGRRITLEECRIFRHGLDGTGDLVARLLEERREIP